MLPLNGYSEVQSNFNGLHFHIDTFGSPGVLAPAAPGLVPDDAPGEPHVD